VSIVAKETENKSLSKLDTVRYLELVSYTHRMKINLRHRVQVNFMKVHVFHIWAYVVVFSFLTATCLCETATQVQEKQMPITTLSIY